MNQKWIRKSEFRDRQRPLNCAGDETRRWMQQPQSIAWKQPNPTVHMYPEQ